MLVSVMETRLLPPEPEGSELERWVEDGIRREPHNSNIVTWVDPEENYCLTVEVDDPVHGYLLRLSTTEEERRIGQVVVDDRELAIDVAAQLAAAADDLDAVDERPHLGPDTIYREDIDEDVPGHPDTPDNWNDEEDWREALEDAWKEADIPRGKGTLTTKTIDGRDYYYLQWREGDTVTSQYVGPVSPAE
jgi:hypothetical protein